MAKYTGPTQDSKDEKVFNNWKKKTWVGPVYLGKTSRRFGRQKQC